MAKISVMVGDRRRENLFGVPGVEGLPPADRRKPQNGPGRHGPLLAAALALIIVAWMVAVLAVPHGRFAVYAPGPDMGMESAAALAELFAALVLFLFPAQRQVQRLRWVAGGLLVLGLGSLVFGYVRSLLALTPTPNTSLWTSLAVATLATALLFAGLVPTTPPSLSRRSIIVLSVSVFAALELLIALAGPWLPPLIHLQSLRAAAQSNNSVLHGLTAWHWTLFCIPLVLALAASEAVALRLRQGISSWLLVSMVLLSGAQLHTLFWPSAYSSVLASADVLSFAFSATVAVGGVLELWRIATERATLLAAEQEHSKRLAEVAVLKADFTAMVAHELSSPLAAVRGFADMLATGELTPEEERQAVATIQAEVQSLTNLVSDVGTAATVERADFAIEAFPVPLRSLLADATAFAKTLPGDHPVQAPASVGKLVWADPDRIGQVLRNLLSNAAKYSPEGTPITLGVRYAEEHVRIEVSDRGYGIHPQDLARIFEKFGRGRDESGKRVPGVGLGLYLSRRIVRAHGSELMVTSTVGKGTSFGFDLEVVV